MLGELFAALARTLRKLRQAGLLHGFLSFLLIKNGRDRRRLS
jgi:hypothetical protein